MAYVGHHNSQIYCSHGGEGVLGDDRLAGKRVSVCRDMMYCSTPHRA